MIRTIVVVLFLIGLGYAATLGPVAAARAKAEVSDGTQPVAVGADFTVVPAQGWLSEPLVHDVLKLPILPDLHSWAVYFGNQTGMLLRSPDRLLTVEIDTHGAGAAPEAEVLLRDRAAEILGAGTDQPAVRTEALVSGTTIWHMDAASSLLAVIECDGDLVSVAAERTDGEPIDVYRPAIGQLIATIE
ncbi:hypothetical protein [Brooklawnia sp.]|uniref:hypothetical protein n=1 Tax=Brooklawnia sp. TaxID=2699740 RepID=UPI00311EA58E